MQKIWFEKETHPKDRFI